MELKPGQRARPLQSDEEHLFIALINVTSLPPWYLGPKHRWQKDSRTYISPHRNIKNIKEEIELNPDNYDKFKGFVKNENMITVNYHKEKIQPKHKF